MSKEYLEVLEKFLADYLTLCEKLHTNRQEKMLLDKNSPYNVLKTYLESIDNAKPSEALECLEKLKGMEISSMPFSDEYGTQEVDLNDIRKVGSQLNTDFREYTDTIKKALLKVQKEHKALEIIKEKNVDILDVKLYENYEHYCRAKEDSRLRKDWWLTKEEFNLLKEVLE